MEEMKRIRIVLSLLIVLFIFVLVGCNFVILPEGHRGYRLFTSIGSLLTEIFPVEFDGGDTWRADSAYATEEHLIIVTRDPAKVLVYAFDGFRKIGQYDLDLTDSWDKDIVAVGMNSDGDSWVMTRRAGRFIFADELIEESYSFEYADHFFEYNGLPYLLVGSEVFDIQNEALVDSVSYPTEYVVEGNEAGWYSHTADTLYIRAVSGIETTLPPGAEMYEQNLYADMTIKIAAFPFDELGDWQANSADYWDNSFTLTSSNPVLYHRYNGQYAYRGDGDIIFAGSIFAISDWNETFIVDLSTETIIFANKYNTHLGDAALTWDGNYLYRISNQKCMQFTIR